MHIRLFAQALAATVAGSTVWGILQALARAFSAMAPECDRTAFQMVLTRIKRRTRLSRDVGARLMDPVTLINVGNQMMDEADRREPGPKAAVLYRNGAIIAGGACVPLRRDAWGKIIIGRHLELASDRGWLTFEASELKATTRPFRAGFPPEYVLRLKRYIITYRPLLLAPGAPDCGALWLTWTGEPLRAGSLSAAVTQALAKRCGKNFSFHMFRHSAATFIENVAPERSLMAAAVLHHAEFCTTQEYYIRGQRTAAMRTYQSCVRQIVRKALRGRRKHPGRAGRNRGMIRDL
jgi:integrase